MSIADAIAARMTIATDPLVKVAHSFVDGLKHAVETACTDGRLLTRCGKTLLWRDIRWRNGTAGRNAQALGGGLVTCLWCAR